MSKLLCLSFTFAVLSVAAQTKNNIMPVSMSIGYDLPAPSLDILPRFNRQFAELNDVEDLKKGELPKFSRSIYTNLNLQNSGTWVNLKNGDRVWRISIKSEGAQALLLYYDAFYLPEGATLHVYNEDKSDIIGAFTYENNPNRTLYATGLTHGDMCTVEYFEPKAQFGKGMISINEVGHAYRWVDKYFPSQRAGSALGFNQSDACEVNINCAEGADWQDQKRAVSCIIVQSQFGQGVCSGALINNVREDCTPYLLSAQHCSENVSSNQYAQWIFHFNYESPDCNNPAGLGTLDDDFVVGCTKRSDSNDNGGDDGSDFLLLELSETPPAEFNVYYAGWSNATSAPSNGVCIHHPEGDIKKISSYQQNGVSTTWGGSTPGTHWRIKWVISTNGHGVTEPGSSGSPVFNNAKQIVGQLTGGDSFCNTPNSPDYFGKFSYNWTSNGTAANLQLKPWLDPDNTGIAAINGRNADCFSSINDIQIGKAAFTVFPNPANDLLQFKFHSEASGMVTVSDAEGRVVMQQQVNSDQFTMNVSTLAKGFYLISLNQQTLKLIIQ